MCLSISKALNPIWDPRDKNALFLVLRMSLMKVNSTGALDQMLGNNALYHIKLCPQFIHTEPIFKN